MKKIFTLMAAMLLVPWVGWGQDSKPWTGEINTDWFDETQSELTITTAEQLAGLAEIEMSKLKGKTIKLGNNIVLNADYENYESWSTNPPENIKTWEPLNFESFQGTIDGNGYEIKGLYIKASREGGVDNPLGLFKSLGYQGGNSSKATVQNLGVTHSYIESTNLSSGGIVGQTGDNALISSCYFDGIIKVEYKENTNIANFSNLNVAGIAAQTLGGDSEIKSCYTKGTIIVDINNVSPSQIMVAGIGQADIISNCYNESNISVSMEGVDSDCWMILIGGIDSGSGKNISCYNTGKITVNGNLSSNSSTMIGIGGIKGLAIGSTSIQYCYNTGIIASTMTSSSTIFGVGNILGANMGTVSFAKNYYLPQDNIESIGYSTSSSENEEGLISADKQFESGEIAHALRDEGGYGQNLGEYGNAIDETPVLLCFAGEEQKVYKLTLKSKDITTISGDIYRNAEPAKLLQEDVYNKLMETAEEGKDLIWKNKKGDVVAIGNDYTPSTDETLMAEWGDVYTITTEVEPTAEAGSVKVSKPKAQKGDEISFTVTANEGYEFVSVTGATFTQGEEAGSYTFTMPAKDVTITATFEKIETGGDDDDEGGIGTKRYQLFLADRDFYLNDKYDAEGLVLFSRHDKRYAEVGGSFTVYYEKDGEVNAGDYRIFWSKSANGEYKEVKLDEVSGYYQIRNVQSDVYVKIYGRDGFPVSNEAIEATEARAYAQANKIIVVTHEPMDVQIVSMAGAVVGNAKVAGQQEFGNLAEGVYIVRLGDTVVKLQVRN